MSQLKNLRRDKLLSLADAQLGDIGRGAQMRQRLEQAKLILELVALLATIPPQPEAEATEGG